MSYTTEWNERAWRSVLDLPDKRLTHAIFTAALRLAAAPTRLSTPTGYPYYGTEQRYRFDVAGRRVALLFEYTQDERSIFITEVSIQ